MPKQLSCGIFIVKDSKILLGHATRSRYWDIPKGKIEEGETPLEAALRECQEEFGLIINPDDLIELGEYPYNREKRLHVFLYKKSKFPNLDDLKCTTFYNHYKTGELLPEIDSYKIYDFSEVEGVMCKSLYKVFSNVLDKIKRN